jgi:23S rRNA pseudouridine2604 synthase
LRLNKYISETGITSRRQADQWIAEGKVTINGATAELGTQVNEDDDVRVNGQRIKAAAKPKLVYIALNKPVGITSTTERHIRGNIVDHVNHPQRVFPIGRLDKDSDGLILLTNDGDIVNPVLRAENKHDKEYIVTVDKPITQAFLREMAAGVEILGTKTLPCQTTRISDNVFNIVLNQGLNRQIRRMCSALGYNVRKLRRIRIMNIHLGDLKVGHWRDLTSEELSVLFETLDYRPSR